MKSVIFIPVTGSTHFANVAHRRGRHDAVVKHERFAPKDRTIDPNEVDFEIGRLRQSQSVETVSKTPTSLRQFSLENSDSTADVSSPCVNFVPRVTTSSKELI
jgi:hypothetical protein